MADPEVRPTARPATGGTPRVSLRPAYPGDAALLQRWRTERSVRRHQPLSTVTLAQLRADLAQQQIRDVYRGKGDKFQWIVLVDGDPAGWLTLVIGNWEHGLAEVGYALTSAHQRRGVMPAALEQLLADLFLRTRLERIEARCAVENLASQKVLERVGFRHEGRLRGYFLLDGERVDNYLYAILGSDFLVKP
jgi:ribosomal-protein-alanine N-acetyltransferase